MNYLPDRLDGRLKVINDTWLRGEFINECWLQSLTDKNLYKHTE